MPLRGILMLRRHFKLTQLKNQLNRSYRTKNKVDHLSNSTILYQELNVIYRYFSFFNLVCEMKNLKVGKNVKSYSALYQE